MLFKKVKNYNELNEEDGFKITVEKDKKNKDNYIITFYGINNIHYIQHISVYLKTFFDIVLGTDSDKLKKIICKNKKEGTEDIKYISDEEKIDARNIEDDEVDDVDEEQDFFVVNKRKFSTKRVLVEKIPDEKTVGNL